MTPPGTSRDETELDALLARRSALSGDYAALGSDEPPPDVDASILAAAKTAAAGTPKAATRPALMSAVAALPTQPVRSPPQAANDDADDDKDDDDAGAGNRRRWIVPLGVAAALVLAVSIGLEMSGDELPATDPAAEASIAQRVRARLRAARAEEDAAEQAAAEQDAEVVALSAEAVRAPLAPPSVFESDVAVIPDMDKAIALIRRELVITQAMEAQTPAQAPAQAPAREESAPASGALADTRAAPAPSVVQPRERRLAKVLELYDDGKPDLAAAVLEVFLRDFEDDPISQRITGVAPPSALLPPAAPPAGTSP